MEIGISQGFYGYIYFDPSDEELIKVAKSCFDTLRMGIHCEDGREYLVFGNGYGTTHSSVSHAMGLLNPRCRKSRTDSLAYQGINGGCFILYLEGNRYLCNASDWSMGEEELDPAPSGEVNGLPNTRGTCHVTDGVLCYIERADGSLFVGHYAFFIPDKPVDDEGNEIRDFSRVSTRASKLAARMAVYE